MKKRGRQPIRIEKKQLAFLLSKGFSTTEIGLALGISQVCAARWLREDKLKAVGRSGQRPASNDKPITSPYTREVEPLPIWVSNAKNKKAVITLRGSRAMQFLSQIH